MDGQRVAWEARLLVVYSPAPAKKARRGLAGRLDRAEQALQALTPPRGRGKRQGDDRPALQAQVRTILKKHGVENLLEVSYHQEVEHRPIRRYGDRPARTEEQVRYVVQVRHRKEAIAAARRLVGWRLDATDAPAEELSLEEGVRAYRGAPRMARNFCRLKGRPLGSRPRYVQRPDHALGLVRLLSLAVRVLTVVEHVVQVALKVAGDGLQGLDAGHPQRETAHPTTERLLRAFREITLSVVCLPDQTIRHVTPLSHLQRRILELVALPASIYEHLALPIESIPP